MNDHPESVAQFIDRFLLRTAIGVALVAVGQAISAAMHVAGDDVAGMLDKLALLLSVAVIVIVLPVFVRLVRMRLDKSCDYSEADSYLAQVLNKACVFAFSLTFVLVVGLKATSGRLFVDQPPDFFLSIIAAASLGIFSVVFFVAQHSDDEPADEFD